MSATPNLDNDKNIHYSMSLLTSPMSFGQLNYALIFLVQPNIPVNEINNSILEKPVHLFSLHCHVTFTLFLPEMTGEPQTEKS